MVNIAELKEGDKVHYQPKHYKEQGKYENGIVKSVPQNAVDFCFVVYNCGGDWKNYKDYTAANTNAVDLFNGWKH